MLEKIVHCIIVQKTTSTANVGGSSSCASHTAQGLIRFQQVLTAVCVFCRKSMPENFLLHCRCWHQQQQLCFSDRTMANTYLDEL